MTLAYLVEDPPVDWIRRHKAAATGALLGTCITLGDTEWQAASQLPGWTRAHVATHLARNAEWLTSIAERTLGRDVPELPVAPMNIATLERGSERSGVELQVDLDSTAGRLNDVLDSFAPEDWARPAYLLPGRPAPAGVIPLQRLNEVTLHRVDLGLGYGFADVSDDVAEWLLRWQVASREALGTLPDVMLVSDDGFRLGLGSHEVSGTRQDLLAWITGRTPDADVLGADSVERPGS